MKEHELLEFSVYTGKETLQACRVQLKLKKTASVIHETKGEGSNHEIARANAYQMMAQELAEKLYD
ncbi:MAG: hypothetical protein U1E51_26285 [Candidatus Binatia bacterium]|nr:hypothetical protein [Candidatus Binatia bacterium]